MVKKYLILKLDLKIIVENVVMKKYDFGMVLKFLI